MKSVASDLVYIYYTSRHYYFGVIWYFAYNVKLFCFVPCAYIVNCQAVYRTCIRICTYMFFFRYKYAYV